MKHIGLSLATALALAWAGCPSTSTLQGQGGGPGGTCTNCKGHGGIGGTAGSSGGSSSGGSSSSGGIGSSTGSGPGASSGTTGGSSSGASGGTGGAVCVPPPAIDAGCWSNEPDGGPCVTLADCATGLMCYYTGCYTGTCVPAAALPTLACTANGQACGPSAPPCCGGECRGGTCAPWTPCGEAFATCQTDLDCCNDFACQAGTCQPTCQQLLGTCQTTSDCCYHQGLECLNITGYGPVCYPGTPYQPQDSQGNDILCGAPCSGWECQLGAACAVAGGIDPCGPAGEVCDPTYHVCRNPETASLPGNNLEQCQPFGEPCLPIPDSSSQSVCIPLVVGGVTGDYCSQACSTTADCVNPIETCAGDSDYGGSICLEFDECQASQYFGPCNSAGTDDGYCYPVDYGSGPVGFCIQATLDGGAAGDRCLSDFENNRQEGGLCDTQDVCGPLGLCEPGCNAGASGSPACDGGQQCFPLASFAAASIQAGYCSPACDFTSPDGGGCPPDSSGIPEKCIPELFVDLIDSPTGVCAAGAAAPVALAQVCPYSVDGQIGAADDPCVAGSVCLGVSALKSLRTCVQLCNRVGQSSGCPTGQLCQAAIIEGLSVNPTHTGYCH